MGLKVGKEKGLQGEPKTFRKCRAPAQANPEGKGK